MPSRSAAAGPARSPAAPGPRATTLPSPPSFGGCVVGIGAEGAASGAGAGGGGCAQLSTAPGVASGWEGGPAAPDAASCCWTCELTHHGCGCGCENYVGRADGCDSCGGGAAGGC